MPHAETAWTGCADRREAAAARLGLTAGRFRARVRGTGYAATRSPGGPAREPPRLHRAREGRPAWDGGAGAGQPGAARPGWCPPEPPGRGTLSIDRSVRIEAHRRGPHRTCTR